MDEPRSPAKVEMELWEKVGANPALGLRPEPAAQFRPIGFDPGYELGAYVPRFMGRLATILATAVLLGLLPVSIAVWMNWL